MAKRKKKEPEQPKACLAPGCNDPTFPGMDFCPTHGLVDMAVEKANKAFKKGDTLNALFSSITAIVINNGGPMVKPAMMGAAARFAQRAQGPPPPRQRKPNGEDPWKVLGLDRKNATEKDVKAVQKHYATFYHPDRGRAVDPELFQRVNAAAEACIKELRSR